MGLKKSIPECFREKKLPSFFGKKISIFFEKKVPEFFRDKKFLFKIKTISEK
jgi:hypothetical protein